MSELRLNTDGHIIKLGADNDVTLTHVADTGILLNSTMKLQFNDASQFIQGSSATVLSIGATDEIDLTATAVDLNGTLNVSGVATFQATPVFPDGSLAVADLDIDGATDIGAAIVDADLFIVDDGAGGTNRKVTASRLKTYAGGAALANDGNNRIVTGDGSGGLNGEANLSFDGSALQCTGTLTVGVDDTGHDVKLFGATSGSYLEWDESADDLNLIASGIGVTTAKDLGTGIHIRTADSGASVNANCDELVIEGSGNSGLTILSGASSEGLIFFGDSGSNAIGRLEYNHSTNAMAMTTGGNTAMIIDGNGHVTKPLQPVFLVTKSGHQNDIAINATTTITFDTERIDINADFASNTFTAPVTGSYQFNFTITWGAYDTDFGYQYTMFVASNRTVYAHLGSGNQITADGYYNSGGSCVIDMDANDTCILKVQFSNDGAAQADASQSSYFSGFLIG